MNLADNLIFKVLYVKEKVFTESLKTFRENLFQKLKNFYEILVWGILKAFLEWQWKAV